MKWREDNSYVIIKWLQTNQKETALLQLFIDSAGNAQIICHQTGPFACIFSAAKYFLVWLGSVVPVLLIV